MTGEDRVIDSHMLTTFSVLAMHVQDFHTPGLCWMLLSTACRMLQALGITGRSLDQKTRERRLWLFWGLSSLDISLAIMFGRPPTFHKGMRERLPILEVHHLVGYQPHLDPSNLNAARRTSLFGAHFMHHIWRIGNILAEIWNCLYDSPSTHRPIEAIKTSLDSWYKETLKVSADLYFVNVTLLIIRRSWKPLSSPKCHCCRPKKSNPLILESSSSDSNITITVAFCCDHRESGGPIASKAPVQRLVCWMVSSHF